MFRSVARRLLVPCGPRIVRRAPKQGEWIWDGLANKPALFPYDTDYIHVVLEGRPTLNRCQKFIERWTRP